jgi:glutamate/aspartate transport system permease protein
MNYAWNWPILLDQPYLGWLVSGLELTVVISIAAWGIALSAGILIGVVGTLPGQVPRFWAATYGSVFRNIPLLLQLFLWFFVVPELLPGDWGRWLKRDLPFPELWTSIFAVGLFTSTRVAVQVAAGIAAVPGGQRMAALASGMSIAQTYRHVLLPQAFRIILPPLTSEFLTIFKNSSVALTVGVFELTAQAQQIESETFHGFEAFTAATVLYFGIALTVTNLMRVIERRATIPGTGGTHR